MTIDEIRQKMCDNYCMFPSETGEVPPVICEYCPLNELDRYKEGDDHDDLIDYSLSAHWCDTCKHLHDDGYPCTECDAIKDNDLWEPKEGGNHDKN